MKKSYTVISGLKIVLAVLLFSSNIFSQVTLRDKIGQMIIVGFYGTGQTGIPALPDSLITDLHDRNLGGVLFFGNNLVSPGQIKTLTSEINASSKTPPFIATDQEGGQVARLNKKNGFQNTYTAYQLGTVFDSQDSARQQTSMMAGWLKDSGINVDFAPVADVNVNPNSPAIGHYGRSFSNRPDTVAEFDGYFIDELHKKNLIATLKHFPGHGSALTDSHLGFTDITNTWADSELVPYKKLFAGGYGDMVMVGHLFNAHLDSLYPASLSYNVITGLLRSRLGFKGVVISDDMNMGAISDNFSFARAVVLAVNAGQDILLFNSSMISNGTEQVSLCDSVVNLIASKVADGEISESRVDDAYSHIMELKQKYMNISSVPVPVAEVNVPDGYSVTNYPNPFNPTTNISFTVPVSGSVTIKLYNSIGQLVSVLVKGQYSPGSYNVVLDGSSLASGTYIAVLQTPEKMIARKILLLK